MNYHEVDGTTTTKNIGTWNNSPAAIQMLRRARVVERGCFRIELHVVRIDAGAIHPGLGISIIRAHVPWAEVSPRIVEVVLTCLN